MSGACAHHAGAEVDQVGEGADFPVVAEGRRGVRRLAGRGRRRCGRCGRLRRARRCGRRRGRFAWGAGPGRRVRCRPCGHLRDVGRAGKREMGAGGGAVIPSGRCVGRGVCAVVGGCARLWVLGVAVSAGERQRCARLGEEWWRCLAAVGVVGRSAPRRGRTSRRRRGRPGARARSYGGGRRRPRRRRPPSRLCRARGAVCGVLALDPS